MIIIGFVCVEDWDFINDDDFFGYGQFGDVVIFGEGDKISVFGIFVGC